MQKVIKTRLKRWIALLLLGYVLLVIFRFFYGSVETYTPPQTNTILFEVSGQEHKNYASRTYKVKGGVNTIPIHVDQKYEKIAEIVTRTEAFETETQKTRKQIEALDALIQFEQKSGNEGYRTLNLVIGVPPENFDTLYNQLAQVGKVSAKQITKTDKTNEYKELNAKKVSLEKMLSSLKDLKSKGGMIEEFMQLENRILEIESELQNLGVSLGNFDIENEFCTIRFSILETKIFQTNTIDRILNTLEWSLETYLKAMALLFFLSLFAYLSLLGVEKVLAIAKNK